jgi:peptidoglycan-associated lipoprotein
MNRNFSNLFSFVVGVLVLLSSLVLIGCPKKVPPVEGTAGLSRDERSAESPSGPGGQRPPAPPREEPAAGEEKLPPFAKGDPGAESDEAGLTAGDGKPGPLQDVFFEFDQWVIQSDARTALEQNARWLEGNPNAKIQIEGHSDERGTDEYNLALGERRAKSAMNFLINLGVSPSRISFISFGEEKGFCSDPNEGCFQQNRRAHFVVR